MRARGGAQRRQPDLAAVELDDRDFELVDVPAAVVCANCGDPACAGCTALDEPTHASGVVAIVPWERPGMTATQRLWHTARLATTGHQAFFSALPDGDAGAALRFAVSAELVAVTGLALALLPVLLLLAPGLPDALLADASLRNMLARALVGGIPGVALLMVVLHAVHGLGLDLGARRQGSRSRRGRGLRFGLYACGWDLVTLPLGLAVVAIADGPRAAARIAPLGMTVPAKAARAYLRGVHQLDSEQARGAARFAAIITGAIVCVGGLVVLSGVVFSVLFR